VTDELLLTADAQRVRTLTWNRPEVANAFNDALYLAATAALEAAAADDEVGAVVLTGAGRSFCAGTDLVEMAAMIEGLGAGDDAAGVATGDAYGGFVDTIAAFPKPLVAAVNGPGIGLGFTMLAHCDLVVMAERGRLLAPFTEMGVAPEVASSYLLPRRMGRQQASRALLASEWISAEDAVACGLALKVVPDADLLAEAQALAAGIAAKPLASLIATKALVLDAEREGIARARELENAAFQELLARPDAAGGVLGQLD
jgi:enoyl-CoA hydratase/carnithine racemase